VPGALKKYAFINAKLRGRISKILPEEFVREMARAATLVEAAQMLAGTGFAAAEVVYTRTGDIKMAELELLRTEVALYREIEGLVEAEVRQLVHALATRFEVEELKNAFRLWFDARVRGRRIEGALGYLLRERVHHELRFDQIVGAASLAEAGLALHATPYAVIVAAQAGRVTELQSLFPLEIALDHHFYRELISAVSGLEPNDRRVAQRLVGVQIDMENISWLIRFKSFYHMNLEQVLEYSIPSGVNLNRELIASSFQSEHPSEVLSSLVRKRYPELSAMLSVGVGAGRQTGEPGARDQYTRLVLIERILQQIMLLEVRKVLGGYPFTVGIILAYFILKAGEIRRLMTVLNGKFYNWPEERIMAAV
jgi:V/A-type H+-transporting ATPase subunit C